METLELHHGRVVVADFSVDERPIEIGRALGCDIVVADPALAPRHWLLARRMGTLMAYDVSRGRRSSPRPVPLGQPWGLGGGYSLLRRDGPRAICVVRDVGARVGELATQALPARVDEGSRLALLLRRGGDVCRYRLDGEPLHIGRAPGNDVVLSDQGVSGRHCRLEPHPRGVVVRDLGSRNGTFVQGVRVERALLTAGVGLRVGHTELRLVEADHEPPARGPTLLAQSSEMLALLDEVKRSAALAWPVLVHGESGTGKEGIAGSLHALSPRAGGPFVTLNAGGVARDLVESELFGHERGAFTGAVGSHRGVFEQADGGTLFLDEIGELPLSLQARLLRVLETGEVRPVGAEQTRRVDVRLVCATHRDLRALVTEGGFRADLYYRIARLVLEVPALRARPDDIALLAEHFLAEIAEQVGPRSLEPGAAERLLAHPWPGNARELRNVLCAAAAATSAPQLTAQDLERALSRVGAVIGQAPPALSREELLREVARHGGNLSAAARALGIARSTLRGRLRAA